LGVELSIEDFIITTIYIKGTNKNLDLNRVKAIIIAHGHSTASSIVNVANRLLGQYVFEAIDMPYDTSIEQISSQLIDYLKDMNTNKGVIILVDMGSLEDIYINLDGIVEGTIGIINNITTYSALNTGSKILNGKEIEDIVKEVSEDFRVRYKTIHNDSPKKKAIITTCVTGIGTANKIKDLLSKSIEEYITDVEIISYEFLLLKNNGKNDGVFRDFQVIAIIGTTNPRIDHVPFIALEDIMLEKSNDTIVHIFKDIANEEEIIKINKKMIKLFSLQSVINHLTILNPDKLMNYIEAVTDQIQIEIGLEVQIV
jgi:sigma-54 dependent transcriptional regulator of gfr operon